MVGAGLAGVHTTRALQNHGCTVSLFDPAPASGGSGNLQGLVYISPPLDDTPTSRFWWAAYVHALNTYQAEPEFHATGTHSLPVDAKDPQRFAAWVERFASPEGPRTAEAGIVWPKGGWLEVAAYVQRQAEAFGVIRQSVQQIDEDADGVNVLFNHATERFDGVVLCNALAAKRFLPDWVQLQAVRGQVTYGRNLSISQPVCGDGYVAPALPDGRFCFGASFKPGDATTALRESENDENRRRLADLVGEAEIDVVGARASLRCASRDYLPQAGRLPETQAWLDALAHLRKDAKFKPDEPARVTRRVAVNIGLGSKGIVTAPWCAERVARELTGQSEADELTQLVHPARFLVRALKRGAV